MIKKWIYKFIYKPNSREIYWEKIISTFVVLAIFFVIVHFTNARLKREKDERDRFKRYVIGVITEEHKYANGNLEIDYSYSFAGDRYSNSRTIKRSLWDKSNTQGERYYVQIAYTNPSNAEIFFDHPVSDSVKNSPDSGWVNFPE